MNISDYYHHSSLLGEVWPWAHSSQIKGDT